MLCEPAAIIEQSGGLWLSRKTPSEKLFKQAVPLRRTVIGQKVMELPATNVSESYKSQRPNLSPSKRYATS